MYEPANELKAIGAVIEVGIINVKSEHTSETSGQMIRQNDEKHEDFRLPTFTNVKS